MQTPRCVKCGVLPSVRLFPRAWCAGVFAAFWGPLGRMAGMGQGRSRVAGLRVAAGLAMILLADRTPVGQRARKQCVRRSAGCPKRWAAPAESPQPPRIRAEDLGSGPRVFAVTAGLRRRGLYSQRVVHAGREVTRLASDPQRMCPGRQRLQPDPQAAPNGCDAASRSGNRVAPNAVHGDRLTFVGLRLKLFAIQEHRPVGAAHESCTVRTIAEEIPGQGKRPGDQREHCTHA